MLLVHSESEQISNLINLGIAFGGKKVSLEKHPILPEYALASAIGLSKKDGLVLSLMRNWIMKYHDLLSTEILKKVKLDLIDDLDKALFLGLLSQSEDKRFSVLYKDVKPIARKKNLDLNKMFSFPVRLGQKSFDKKMLKFGIEIVEFTDDDDKKFLSKSQIMKTNRFLKNRLLFGTNARADVATLVQFGFKNPYQISKFLASSYDTAYRNYKNLIEAGWPEIVFNKNS